MTTLARRQFLQLLATGAGLSLLAACQPITRPPTAAQPLVSPQDAALFAELEKEAQATLEKYHVPGMAVGIVREGQLIYSQGFGVMDSASGRSLTPQSVQSMASISKAFTATAIMQLVEAGKVDVDQPMVEYVPYFRMDDAGDRSCAGRDDRASRRQPAFPL